jgi:hypothetical protein
VAGIDFEAEGSPEMSGDVAVHRLRRGQRD